MQDDAGSSSSISSPPISPPHHHSINDTIHVARPPFANPGKLIGEGVVVANAASATSAQASKTTAHVANGKASASSTTVGTAPEKPKRQRKKKETGPDGKPDDKPKEKKPRKPREPKDKTAGANGEKSTASRSKKQKVEPKVELHDASVPSRQPTITEMVGGYHQPTPPPPTPASTTTLAQPQHRAPDSIVYSSVPQSLQTPNTASPRPFSSGQNYDPIRGSTKASVPPPPPYPTNGAPSAQASPHVYRASASPAIASLIDPPLTTMGSAPQTMHSPQTQMQQPILSSHNSPSPHRPTPAFPAPAQHQPSPSTTTQQPTTIGLDGAMDLTKPPTCDATALQKAPKSKSSSSAPTPKAARPTPPPQIPKGTGSGMLSASDLFGGGASNSEPATRRGITIDLHIPLDPRGGNTVNIAQEITKKYGRDAVNPRAAMHREAILRMQEQANKFSGGEGDDMSVDLMSEAEGDSNVEMGGMEDGQSGMDTGDAAKPTRKRRRKVEEYDKEDDFIDDTELAWQEQAAVAKDGFFVYSGPLIPEGETAQVESAAPTRGRGRGRGSRGGRAAAAAAGTTHASLADSKSKEAAPAARARTRGTRGTGAPRKPRITKADRERLEAEKTEREKAAAGMGGSTAVPHVTNAPNNTMSNGMPMTGPTAQQGYVQPPTHQPSQSFFPQQPTGTPA